MERLFFFTTLIYFYCLCHLFGQQKTNQTNIYTNNSLGAFEQNKGQIYDFDNTPASYVQYHYKQGNINLFLLKTGIAYQFNQLHYPEGYLHYPSTPEENKTQLELQKEVRLETYRMDMKLMNANPNATVIQEGKSNDYTNYYNRHILEVYRFQKITYKDIYPNIDWVIYTTKEGIKYDFIVHPGADPNQIKMKFSHHEGLKINTDGSFSLSNSMGTITEKKPISFQGDKSIPTQFQLENNTISFQLSSYNPNEDLTIDPSLVWATYYGGNADETQGKSTVDYNGNVYSVGSTSSTNNIAATGHQNTNAGGTADAFVVKFNSNEIRQWATYYGGNGNDQAFNCITDNNNNIYLLGYTNDSIPTTIGSHQNSYGGGSLDAFLVKFNTNGTLLWTTHYGGSGTDYGRGCAIDNNDNIYITGYTSSPNNMAINGYQNTFGGIFDGYLAKFNSNGIRQWATYYGSNRVDYGNDCAIDNNNNIYLAGVTRTPNFSTVNLSNNGHQSNYGGGFQDALLVKFNSNGIRQWATYYGGSQSEAGSRCTVDSNNNIYLAGFTDSNDSISSGGHQNAHGGGPQDGFLVKFNSNGVRQWGTYYGGSDDDRITGCSTDNSNNVYVAGFTASSNNIASGGHQNTYGGDYDAFLVEFNTNGIRQWGTYYGDSGSDVGISCPVDNNGNVYLCGLTNSTNNISSNGHQNVLGGNFDRFLAKFQDSVTLLSTDLQKFEAHRITNDKILLEWTIDRANQVEQFIIERSFDTYFETITRLPNNQLSFVDEINANTIVYYRLKTITTQGTITYSDIKAVQGNQIKNNITIYPNPTSGLVTITTTKLLKNASVRIISVNGQVQIREDLNNTYTVLDSTTLPSGIYIVQIQSDIGTSNTKLIKQ